MLFKNKLLIIFGIAALFFTACGNQEEELTMKEAQALKQENKGDLLSRTITKPGGKEPFAIGIPGGTWNSSITNDPKTFNLIIAENDGASANILGNLLPGYLVDYDAYKKQWEPKTASYDIQILRDENRMDVKFTLRDDLFWSWHDRDEKIKITSDDVIFWYNDIDGNPDLQMATYGSQFVTMADGSQVHIDIEKIDELSFVFHFPRIVANPLLSCNMTYGPRFLYEKALREGGAEGVKDIFTIDTDVKELPSGGSLFLTEYTPGVRLVYEKNSAYWDTDMAGNSIPYIQKTISKIVPDMNTNFLLFKNGERDSYQVRSEDLEELLNEENSDFSVYNGGASFNADFISFNQNPVALPSYMQEWFSHKEFRQAMSCLVNRERMIKQIYRGLGTPFQYFFQEANIFYNPEIKLEYNYDPGRALKLLASIGIKQDTDGIMRDSTGRELVFDIITNSDNNLRMDSANIFSDECAKLGIKVNLKPLDFQKMVEMLTQTYDWHAVLISLGLPYWPTQGVNVWVSNGNLHLWHPLQESPATTWEARLDYLHNEASYTPEKEIARPLWDEYQRIILEELPVIHLVHSNAFFAIRDKWQNVYYDTLGGLDSDRLYLKDTQ
ncbi:MAG: ABC transporter substrate-binding protein [Spirochaetaceae bacterium 4572_59]|nr:MAG: ABC transporter substrate-binding protein [Spirochaetaceae bacterium 4572_59]